MYHHITIFKALLILIEINAQSTDEQLGLTYSNHYAASTVNFHDIYTNNLDLISDEPSTSKDEELHISNILSQSAEFHVQAQTVGPETTPSPMYILNRSQLLQSVTIPTSTASTTTEDTEESSIKVLPIKNDFQRGVLDLLFPAARVRTFKSVFDSVRRLLSHTFRK